MKRLITATAAVLCLLPALDAAAADAAHGKSLHDAKCTGCHDTRKYTRPNRIIHSLQDLQARVEFCDNAASAGFGKQDIADVVAYLNSSFYKFPAE